MSERKFTDEEIIAVVKRCASPVNECEGCPFEGVHRGDRECFNVATDELIEIASRLKKEIAALKQSEWISVEERLPDAIDSYIVVVKQKYEGEAEWEYDTDVASFVFCDGYIDGVWDTYNDWKEGQECHITHWMPLPEPPKMKGGAE